VTGSGRDFSIKTDGRDWIFMAQSSVKAKEWIQILNAVRDITRQQSLREALDAGTQEALDNWKGLVTLSG
jgi:predicted nucleic acid-binding protein